ncbi:MAG: barstar family protein [Clostridia bacterium]|nr:barstar family protein [Clostridia bacterium]
MMRTMVLDGNNFSDMEGFYNEMECLLTKNLSWRTGHNLDALNDLLRGGFGVHEYEEPITIRWINYKESKKNLGNLMVLKLLEVMLDCNDSGHDVKVELID